MLVPWRVFIEYLVLSSFVKSLHFENSSTRFAILGGIWGLPGYPPWNELSEFSLGKIGPQQKKGTSPWESKGCSKIANRFLGNGFIFTLKLGEDKNSPSFSPPSLLEWSLCWSVKIGSEKRFCCEQIPGSWNGQLETGFMSIFWIQYACIPLNHSYTLCRYVSDFLHFVRTLRNPKP